MRPMIHIAVAIASGTVWGLYSGNIWYIGCIGTTAILSIMVKLAYND